MTKKLTILSWGCGVQSTTIGEMSACGDLPPLDAILTADTGWESRATYEARDYYIDRWRKMGQRVEIVSGGDIRRDGAKEHIHIPFFTSDGGPLQRQCTHEFKIIPIKRRARELAGYDARKPPHPKPGAIECWLGISTDEWQRMKASRVRFMINHYPLIYHDPPMSRNDCIDYLSERGLLVPPKSACICCPYRRASEWLKMPHDEFQDAVEFDEANRHNPLARRGGITADEIYLYKRAAPLATADLESDAARERHDKQLSMLPHFCESGFCMT